MQTSKTISHALRHNPELYGLKLDKNGWVLISDLLTGVGIVREDLDNAIKTSNKKRFEIDGDKIRAYYGHSSPEVVYSPSTPPKFLYHGTSPEAAKEIMASGLKPMNRRYVHLSIDTDTALIVGRRHSKQPVILRIDTRNTVFYHGNENVWLADYVSAEYINEVNAEKS